jgi:hypothetical protein
MDYNFQKALNALNPTYANYAVPKLTSTPARIRSNPGIGNIVRLYSLYVPIHTNKNIVHEIKKQIEPINDEEQIGKGQNNSESHEQEVASSEKQEVGPSANQTDSTDSSFDSSIIKKDDNKDDSIRGLSAGVAFAFKHPAITTDKLVFVRSKKKPEKKNSESEVPAKKPKLSDTQLKHKFQFL